MREEPVSKLYAQAGSEEGGELSLVQLIWQDYLAFLGVVAPLVIWALVIFIFSGKGINTTWIIAGVTLTLAGAGVFAWRVMFFRGIFENNQHAQAVITHIFFYRDRGQVRFAYTYNGQKYESGSPIMKTARTLALVVGDEVTVLIDQTNPKQAIIRKLYTRGG